MDFWEFAFGWVASPVAWGVLSALLAVIAVVGFALFVVFVATELRWYVNVWLVPLGLFGTYSLVMLLAYSGTCAGTGCN
jgi:hypothetical protein